MTRILMSLALCWASASAFAQGSLQSLMTAQGFGGAKLERRFPNHLVVRSTINGRHAGLLVDTGAPITIIDKNSVNTLGLTVSATKTQVGGIWGMSTERYGKTMVKSLALGNLAFSNVTVGVSDENGLNYFSNLRHLDGIFGYYEMKKYGAAIDCARQMIYIHPGGASAGLSRAIENYLVPRGFVRIPMKLNAGYHLEVTGSINGNPASFVVDTGAGITLLTRQKAISYGISPMPLRLGSETPTGRFEVMDSGTAKSMKIGDFEITNADVTLGNVSPGILDGSLGLLGEENLSFNFAVIDVGGMNLYLRHPDHH